MVEAEDDPLGSADHGALDFDEEGVGVGDAVEGDAPGAHDGDIGVQFGERFDGEGADENPEAMIEDASGEDDFDWVRIGEVAGDGQ